MSSDTIYLDHNSTSPILPDVVRVMADCYAAGLANPASVHHAGRESRRVVQDAREGIARLLGADASTSAADHVILTSGGTEANNLALRGLVGDEVGRVIISGIEHPSVVGAADYLQRQGFELQRLRVTEQGVVDVEHLSELLEGRTRLVSVMLGNNETGVLQPLRELAAICRQAGVPLHTDAVQVVGKLPVDFHSLGVTAMSLSAHKFHGPVGIGALIVRHDSSLQPILYGGFQQMGLRPGTESVALCVGMHAALRLWHEQADARRLHMQSLRDRLESLLRASLPDLVVNGEKASRLPHTSSISFPGLDRQALLMALDLAGIACSTGSACASGSTEPSPVLRAMGCSETVLRGALRFSLAATTTVHDVDRAANRILQVVNDLRGKKISRFTRSASREKTSESV